MFAAGTGELSATAAAYARARGADRMSSYGDWVAVSDRVDLATARLLKRETSDGIIAPGYDRDALAVLRGKKGGGYRVLAVDPDYRPPATERREVFGVALEQPRNDTAIDRGLLADVPTAAREIPRGGGARHAARADRPEVHAVQLGVHRVRRPDHRHRRGPAIAYPLHPARRRQGARLVLAFSPGAARGALSPRHAPPRPRHLDDPVRGRGAGHRRCLAAPRRWRRCRRR